MATAEPETGGGLPERPPTVTSQGLSHGPCPDSRQLVGVLAPRRRPCSLLLVPATKCSWPLVDMQQMSDGVNYAVAGNGLLAVL